MHLSLAQWWLFCQLDIYQLVSSGPAAVHLLLYVPLLHFVPDSCLIMFVHVLLFLLVCSDSIYHELHDTLKMALCSAILNIFSPYRRSKMCSSTIPAFVCWFWLLVLIMYILFVVFCFASQIHNWQNLDLITTQQLLSTIESNQFSDTRTAAASTIGYIFNNSYVAGCNCLINGLPLPALSHHRLVCLTYQMSSLPRPPEAPSADCCPFVKATTDRDLNNSTNWQDVLGFFTGLRKKERI